MWCGYQPSVGMDSSVGGVCRWQARTMPLQAAHAASFQGHALRLEVQPQGHAKLASTGRLRVNTFSNAYVGQLRRQIAALLGVPPGQLRLLHGGEPSPAATAAAAAATHRSIGRPPALLTRREAPCL